MNKRSKNFHIVSWKKYLLLLSIFLGSVYCLYEVKQFHDDDILYFNNPFLISLVFAIPIGYHLYNLKYYLDGKTLVAKGLIDRNFSIDKLKYISARNKSLDLVNRFGLFSITLRSEIQELNELTALIDEVLIYHPEVKIKGPLEYREKWFPKTFAARKT